MTSRYIFLFLVSTLFLHIAAAQQQVRGRIFSSNNDSIISSANATNKNTLRTVPVDSTGNYRLSASEGDTLIFSAIGFLSDTAIVEFYMLISIYDVSLQQKIISLQNVKVNSYKDDSLARRNFYQPIFKKQPGITGNNRPTDGVGISFSPISYFSREARQKRLLKKRLINEEKESYIDFRFSPELVKRLTGLSNDSLSLYMYRYRPSYDFCRKTDGQGMIIYISDNLKEFKKPYTN